MRFLDQFLENGYAVTPVDHTGPLLQLRAEIFDRAKSIFGYSGNDPERFFNEFHSLQITGARLNELRVKLISECTQHIDAGRLIFEAIREQISGLLGPDLLVQKNTNLVIQQPGDPNPSEVHRDAPANSPFELVAWVPLVDCFNSKCMYVLDRAATEAAAARLQTPTLNWADFEQFCVTHGREPDVPFGSVLLFWPALYHGSRINRETSTRWSLNIRFKSLFSPTGMKEPFEFFKILQLSPLAKLAIEFQRKQVLS
jgi:sporadic carbohydrate cluster 2OG-Fe(II) oxygenase